jgi:hypothetical protein
MKITDPEILKIIADRNQRIVELAAADATLTISEIAALTHCSKDTVAIVFRGNNINRKVGRPKAVSNV